MIGEAGRPVRVISFAGGGFGTLMQLGVTHALVVMRAERPDVVAGVSLGAVQATVLAEVLRAGDHLPLAEDRYQKQIERLTFFIEEALSAPVRLATTLLPDAYQVRSREPLVPLRLPTQSQFERDDREEGVASRLELIQLANDLISIDIKISTITRLVRAALGFRAAGEASTALRARWGEAVEALEVCRATLQALVPLATLTRRIQAPIFRDLIHRAAHALPFDHAVFHRKGRHQAGRTAAQIMNRSAFLDGLCGALLWIPALLINASLWLLVVAITVGLFARAAWTWLVAQAARIGRRQSTPSEPKPFGPPPGAGSRIADFITDFIIRPILRARQLDSSLLETQVLRSYLIRVFDRGYYGTTDASGFDEAVARSFADGVPPAVRDLHTRKVGWFSRGQRPIHLGIAAANLSTGELELMRPEVSVVRGLLAATATVPWFEVTPIEVTGACRWYFDGLNISREPVQVILDLLRTEAHPQSTGVLIYAADHLTSASKDLNDEELPFPTWVEVARRAADLKKLRDARLEWRLTDLISRLVPSDSGSLTLEGPGDSGRTFLRTRIDPIEPEETLNLGAQIADATSDSEREQVILTAIAKGCRATMEALLKTAIAHGNRPAASCRDVMEERLSAVPDRRPGQGGPPGIAAVCRHCTCCMVGEQGTEVLRASLRAPTRPAVQPQSDWPVDGPILRPSRRPGHQRQPVELEPLGEEEPALREGAEYAWPVELGSWPKAREVNGVNLPGRQRPLVSLLFSGGVFRGVYLVGVVNALAEIGVRPDLIAGASVGSVTAILAANALAQADPGQRALQIARFSSVFLGLDRLILTDTFADFIRTFTLRSSQAQVSLRDIDRVLRRFDEGQTDEMTADLRRVSAGLERLFYFTAFDLLDVVRSMRYGRTHDAKSQLTAVLHKWLRRDGAQWEILGAEPLAEILGAYVLDGRRNSTDDDRSDVPFHTFLRDGIYLLATATNLTRGQLQLFGDLLDQDPLTLTAGDGVPPSLLQGALASSAFPGVFRPRWAWEVFRGRNSREQFTDGGVMDNLPLDAVAHFIHRAAKEGLVANRPEVTFAGRTRAVPHLLFTASLESDTGTLQDWELRRLQRDWWLAAVRIKQLGVNRKIDSYRSAQRHLRALLKQRANNNLPLGPNEFVPADLEVVDVRPRWLCSTFGFHPMMGFRRQRQAESIAHGCATTLIKWQLLLQDTPASEWAPVWGIDPDRVAASAVRRPNEPPVPRSNMDYRSGACVFRAKAVCPYSATALSHVDLPSETRRELEGIYQACRRPQTHLGPADVARARCQ